MSTAPEIKQDFQPVLCDMCLDKPMRALKTCLKCEISMCAQHLQAHLTTPVLLKTHPLTKPITPEGLSFGAVRCPEHGKFLEYYCLDDRTCICASCCIEDQHKLHNMKTLPSAHKMLVKKLREELKELSEREIQGKALKSWETEKRKALNVSSECLVKGVSALRDIGLTKVQNSVSARLGVIQAARQNIEAALSEEDAHPFLQRFAGVHEAVEKARVVDFIHGLEEKEEPGEVVADILKNGHQAMVKVRKLQTDLLVLFDPDNQYWGRDNSTNVMFDRLTIGKCFVSSDFKMLFCQPHIQDISQRVYFQNSTDDDLYWTIQFSEKYDWSVGICAQILSSKGSTEKTLRGPLYGLEWKNKKLSALYTSTVEQNVFSLVWKVIECPPKPRSTPQSVDFPNKLEVQWDCSSQSLSFFSRGDEYDELICLHSLDIDSSSLAHKLRPFVTLEKGQDPASSMSSGYNQTHMVRSSPYIDFVCALTEKIGSGPPTKKRKVI